jgi:hypothetical protein
MVMFDDVVEVFDLAYIDRDVLTAVYLADRGRSQRPSATPLL